MRILLVLHKYTVSINDPCCFPLGYMYISMVLKQAGYTVDILNQNISNVKLENVIDYYDCIMFTGFEEFLPMIIKDAKFCRSKGKYTVIGGALATFKSDLCKNFIDTIIVGEGEDIIRKVLGVEGIYYGTPPDLNSLPYPDYIGFGIDTYKRSHSPNYIGILTSRGCKFHCNFCSQTCHYQERDLKGVFEEVDFCKVTYGAEYIIYNDNTLNLNKDRFIKLCEETTLPWAGCIRLNYLDEEVAKIIAKSKCQYLIVGVESFNQEKLNMMNKGITVKQITDGLDLLNKYNINYHGNILVGFGDDTYIDVVKDVASIPTQYNVFPVFVQPFIGTICNTKHKLTSEEHAFFSNCFTSYAESKNKTYAKELEVVCQ